MDDFTADYAVISYMAVFLCWERFSLAGETVFVECLFMLLAKMCLPKFMTLSLDVLISLVLSLSTILQ